MADTQRLRQELKDNLAARAKLCIDSHAEALRLQAAADRHEARCREQPARPANTTERLRALAGFDQLDAGLLSLATKQQELLATFIRRDAELAARINELVKLLEGGDA
jgi:hypothetical protein